MRAKVGAWVLVAFVATCSVVAAHEPAPAATADPRLAEARTAYATGVEHVRDARWGEALAAFQRSEALRPHATTTYNIAACERALARYTRAWRSYRLALEEDRARPGELSSALRDEAIERVREMEQLMAYATLTLEPASATLAVDGAPLWEEASTDGKRRMIAGVLPSGAGKRTPSRTIELVVNPGAHVFTVSLKGYADIALSESFLPGGRRALDLVLARLPATIHVAANVEGAIVRLNGTDVGIAPVSLRRPQGSYAVSVARDGFVTYEANVRVNAGEESWLRASLSREERSILRSWWFWAGAAAVVAGGVGITYAVTRPEPSPPPYDGGSSGWVVFPQGNALRW